MRRRVKGAGIKQGVNPFVTGYPEVAAAVVETSYSSFVTNE